MNKPRYNPPAIGPTDFGKLPPSAVDLEETTLGALLLSPNAIFDIADDFVPEVFYKSEHQITASAILDLFQQDKPIDMLTTSEMLRSKKQLDEIGGIVYLMKLMGAVSSASHIQEHFRIVKQKYLARELIRISSEIQGTAFDESLDLQDLLDYANGQMDSINDKATGKRMSSHISAIMEKSKESLRKREVAAKQNKLAGIKTPLIELDKLTQGWQPDVTVLAGRPSMGKTAFMLSIAKTAAMNGVPVCIYSLEMSDLSLGNRLLLSESDVDANLFRSGYIHASDWNGINKGADTLKRLPIYVDDNPVVGINYIKSHARTMHKKGRCGMLLLDYLQIATMESAGRNSNRDYQIGEFMRGLVKLKKQLGIPIIVLSQLNRDVDKFGNKRPTLSNLRESGSIEQDADNVYFIHLPWKYGIKEDHNRNSWEGNGLIIVEKQREGSLGDVRFTHNPAMTRFRDWVNPNNFSPQQPISNRDRQLPPEKDVEDIPDQPDLPF
jgi:replicative DNA helicase